MQTELANMLDFYDEYIRNKQFTKDQLDCTLSDCLFRYIHLWEVIKGHPKEKLIDCIKQYNKLNITDRFNVAKQKLPELTETNRLLLIKCVYYENKHEIIHLDQN